MALASSYHFVSAGDLPEIDGKTSMRDVYELLKSRDVGAFVLIEDNRPVYYVKAAELGQLVLRMAQAYPNAQYENESIRDLVRNALEQQPIVPVWPDPVGDNAEEASLTQADPAAFVVVDSGKRMGWFLNHEHVVEAKTRRPRYKCPDGHETFDPDSGKCWCGLGLEAAA